MIDFMMWLIFGKSVLLTPHSIDIAQGCVMIEPKSTMVVRGGGAGVVVELAYSPEDHWPVGIIDRLDRIKRDFPPGRLTGTAYRANGSSVAMENHDEQGAGNDAYDLFLASETDLLRTDKHQLPDLREPSGPGRQDLLAPNRPIIDRPARQYGRRRTLTDNLQVAQLKRITPDRRVAISITARIYDFV